MRAVHTASLLLESPLLHIPPRPCGEHRMLHHGKIPSNSLKELKHQDR